MKKNVFHHLWAVVLINVFILSCKGFQHRQVSLIGPTHHPVHTSFGRRSSSFELHAFSKRRTNPENRFSRCAPTEKAIDEECILTINNKQYNLTEWANAHPGGVKILRNFNGKNATLAFEKAGHSLEAFRLLESFQISSSDDDSTVQETTTTTTTTSGDSVTPLKPSNIWKRARAKLISHEDPFWIHKSLGIYSLLHFVVRLTSAMFGKDPSAGMGGNLGKGATLSGIVCLIPHLLLSYSSLIFDTVPRERVVGKPMIWKENRWHSIVFGTRSVLCTIFCWLSIKFEHAPPYRSLLVLLNSVCILATLFGADMATFALQPTKTDSSVATLPFWEGCTSQTQKRIKYFYAYTQFVATSVCTLVANPIWPFLMLFPIQFASFLLTLCRKGLIGAKGWHIGYAGSLILPFFLSLRVIMDLQSATFIAGLLLTSGFLFLLRMSGINKYMLWVPLLCWRVLLGDKYIPYEMW